MSVLIENNERLKAELNQILGYLIGNKEVFIKDSFPEFLNLLRLINNVSYNLNSVTIYPSSIDSRQVNCACGKEGCNIGLSFDPDSHL